MLRVLSNAGVMTNILDLIAAGGGGGGGGIVTGVQLPLSVNGGVLSLDVSGFCTSAQAPLALTNGALSINLTAYATVSATNTAISNALSAYTDTTNLTALLAGKISTSHPANNVGSAAVNFGAYPITASALTLTNKDLTQGSSGELLWNNQEVQLRSQAFHQINAAAPLTVSVSGNTATIDILWKPSQVSLGSGISGAANDANGTLALAVDTTQIATVASVNAKQDALTAGANIQLTSSGVLSATGDVTLAYVQTNFLSPLGNPGSLGVLAGLQSTMTANTWIIGVDEQTDSRTQFILRDSGNTARLITANTAGELLYNNAALATTAALGSKQDTLSTTGQGVFLNGSVLNGYDLRWNVNAVPNGNIQCLHFRSGLDVTEVLNLNTGQLELQVQGRTDIADITGLQAEVNKLTDVIDGVSGISLGVGSGASQRIAIYEIEPNQALTAGHYFYGLTLFEGASQGLGTGLAFHGGSGAALPDQSGTGGRLPDMLITFNGDVGIGNVNPSQKLTVSGNILATGNLTASTKNFDIVHPTPEKAGEGYHLRHWCVETDSPGGSLIYRRTIDMTSTSGTLEMPDWFQDLAKNVTIHRNPYQHFGSGW